MAKRVAFDTIPMEDVKNITKPTHTNLSKLAMQYSDGVVFAESGVSPELEKYASEIDVPVVHAHADIDPMKSVDEFYDSVLLGKAELVD